MFVPKGKPTEHAAATHSTAQTQHAQTDATDAARTAQHAAATYSTDLFSAVGHGVGCLETLLDLALHVVVLWF